MANDNKIFDFGEKLGDSAKDRNFGVRTMPQKERWQHMNRAYDSFMDLANALGFSPSSIAMGGRLAICLSCLHIHNSPKPMTKATVH